MKSTPSIRVIKRQTPSLARWVPHKYQRQGVKFLVSHAEGALFMDPGLGKSSITLEAIRVLREAGYGPALVVAPLRVCYGVWDGSNPGSELRKWTNFHGMTSVVLHGKDKARLVEDNLNVDLYVINPDGLAWLIQSGQLAKLFRKHRLEVMVIDELSKFKHHDTKRFKDLKKWLPRFKIRWGLTGSPASNGLTNLFGQMYAIDMGKSLGRYVTHFRNNYFIKDFNGFGYLPMPGAEARIYEAIAPKVLRMSAEDYLELPPLLNNIIRFDLPPDVRRVYDELEDHLFTVLDDAKVTAANAAVASSKCRQVCSGGVYVEELGQPRTTKQLHNIKTEMLRELLDELQGQQLLVVYEFEHDLDRLRKEFGDDLPYIGGGVSAKRSSELEKLWNQGKLPMLVGHPASMGHGLNLQGSSAAHIFWYTQTWDYELADQTVRRLRRQGTQAKTITCHIPMARDTIEEGVYKALGAKARTQNDLFDALKALRNVVKTSEQKLRRR